VVIILLLNISIFLFYKYNFLFIRCKTCACRTCTLSHCFFRHVHARGGGGFGNGIRHRRREEGGAGATIRLIRVEDCSLNIESRHNFIIKYIIFIYFININSYLCVVRHCVSLVHFTLHCAFLHVCATPTCVLLCV
jgi:hypothetical protein